MIGFWLLIALRLALGRLGRERGQLIDQDAGFVCLGAVLGMLAVDAVDEPKRHHDQFNLVRGKFSQHGNNYS